MLPPQLLTIFSNLVQLLGFRFLSTLVIRLLMGSFPAKTRRTSDVYGSLGLDELPDEEAPAEAPQVVPILATFLEKSIKKNDKLLRSSRRRSSVGVTAFHGVRAPSLTVLEYLERISKYARCSPSCFVIAFIYIDRFVQRKSCLISSLNVHRLLITCVMVAAKFIDDASFNNAYFAKVGGVSTMEMNKLEMELIFSLDFRLHVTLETFDQYCVQLEKEAPGSCQIERPIIQVCGWRGRWANKDETKCSPNLAGYTCRAI